MTDALEGLSSKALHDLAVHHALRHVNVKFFWDLMKILPAAEVVADEFDDAEMDLLTMRGHIDDITDSGEGEVADGLRPYYIDYLRKHKVKP